MLSLHVFSSCGLLSSVSLQPPNTLIFARSCFFDITEIDMQLRHLQYFVAVGEALSFTKAAAKLRVAQPALSRQVQDLEDEIGVDLFKRSRHGITVTAEGKLFLAEARDLLKRAEAAVEKVRALARGQQGELHIGYAAAPTVELLTPALAAFQKAFPRINVVLHDLSRNEVIEGLLNGVLELAVTPHAASLRVEGIEFETLQRHPFYIALPPGHRLSRLKTITLERAAAEPLVGLRRNDNPSYYQAIERMFGPLGIKPRVAVECDTLSSLITAIETGRGIGLAIPAFKHMSGKRLLFRPLVGTNEVLSIGIVRATSGDLTPAGENFCEMLRKVAKETLAHESPRLPA